MSRRNGTDISKGINLISRDIQKLIDDGELQFSINVEGNDIDITEEIASMEITFNTLEERIGLAMRLVNAEDSKDINKLSDMRVARDLNEFVIINSTNNAKWTHLKYIVYYALKNKYRKCGEYIALMIMSLLDGVSNTEMSYGVDRCMLATVLYWVNASELMGIVLRHLNIRPKIDTEMGGTYNIECTDNIEYKEFLMGVCSEFGELYYNLKTDKISKKEFVRALVTENGKLPLPKYDTLYTSPEFSWRVVESLSQGEKLSDMAFEESTKQIISQIFQCYYDSVYYEMAINFKFIVLGYFYYASKESIDRMRNENKAYKTRENKYIQKLKDNKDYIRNLHKKIKELKEGLSQHEVNNKKLEDKICQLKKGGATNLEPYLKRLKEKKKVIESLKEKMNEAGRINDRNKLNIIELSDANNSLIRQIGNLEDKIEEMRFRMGQIRYMSDNLIPLDSIINSIKDRKIVIVGGDKMHSYIKGLGFKNIRLVESGMGIVNPDSIKYAEVIVIVTGQTSHAVTHVPKNIADSYNIPLIYFNHGNIDMLCREIFALLYSSECMGQERIRYGIG